MTTFAELHLSLGAELAQDQIPLHYNNLEDAFQASQETAVIMERSHEGRLELYGRDAFSLIQRISTNDVLQLKEGEGAPTIFTSPIARILDRVVVLHSSDHALVLTEPGRASAVQNYLQRNIFFNDEVRLQNITKQTRQLNLHGAKADEIVQAIDPTLVDLALYHHKKVTLANQEVTVIRNVSLSGGHFTFVCASSTSAEVFSALLDIGKPFGLLPAGSLTYNMLRISAGRPGVHRELTQDYIPLEAGLWNEVSFTKGCYTGQEIIARMESRNRLAKTIVTVSLSKEISVPAPITHEGHTVGTLTSNVTLPDGSVRGIAFIKMSHVKLGAEYTSEGAAIKLLSLAGSQPASVEAEIENR